MTKLFITGGAGFIGSAFIRLALALDPQCQIVNYDFLSFADTLLPTDLTACFAA